MATIKSANIRKILDSRGNFTVEVEVLAERGAFGRAAAPSGASKGRLEVSDYPAKGIDEGISQFKERVVPALVGNDLLDQKGIDLLLHEIDGTGNFAGIGGNISIATSLAAAKAAAKAQDIELYRMLAGNKAVSLPRPLGNIVGGGKHAINGTTMQEFLSVPNAKDYAQSAAFNVAVHKKVGELLKKRFQQYPIGIGDEKAWVAAIDDTEAVKMLNDAIGEVRGQTGTPSSIAIDLAASEFYENGIYKYREKRLSTAEQIDLVSNLAEKFPIKMLEDPLDQDDFEGFSELTRRIGKSTIIVGDDLFVTNSKRLEMGIKMHAANGILIKPNQIGTLTDMMETVRLAEQNGYERIISHRSGETEDATIAHLAVGLGIRYIKTGTIGGERTAKHNELIRIEEMEGST